MSGAPAHADPMRASSSLALARLLRLASPALPVGAFGYSQGLETAIQQGWVRDESSLRGWILDVLAFNLSRFEATLLRHAHRAWCAGNFAHVVSLNAQLIAARETAELRAESQQMGASLRTLFDATAEFEAAKTQMLHAMTPLAFPTAFAFAAAQWDIAERDAVLGYLFAWAENQAAAAMKSMRLGHVAAQRILADVAVELATLVETMSDDEEMLSNFAPALAIASSLHETQDSRVFRS